MDLPSWGNNGRGNNNGEGLYEFGSFTRLLESGVYPENYANNFTTPSDEGPSNVEFGQQMGGWASTHETATSGEGYINRYRVRNNEVNENMGVPINNNRYVRQSNYVASEQSSFSDSEEEETLVTVGTIGFLEGIKKQCGRRKPQPFHTSMLRGHMYVAELLNGCEDRFTREMGMPKDTFCKIVIELEQYYGWTCQRQVRDGVSCFESFAMFMHLMRGNSNKKTQDRFQHSGDTVSRHVHKILGCMNIADKIKPTRSQDDTDPYLEIRDIYRPFKGHCIGALDGTHVMMRCRKKEEERKFFGRKGFATQNIMVVCDFDLTFVFASAGWEGTHHDYSIFKRCVLNPDYCFPQPGPGKYYLVDAGYPNQPGFLAPYKGLRYHQADFRRGRRRPNGPKEYFNRAHSSLRSCIERTFGVWKARFMFLANMPWYPMRTQVALVLASMAIHNFIRRDRVPDEYFFDARLTIDYVFEDIPDADPEQEDREDVRDDVVDAEHDPNMDDIRNDIMRALIRQRSRRM